MNWEFDFLYWLQGLHNPIMDRVMIVVTSLGNMGIFWIVLSLILVLPRKYRKAGSCMLVSIVLSFVLGNLIIKNVVHRTRPFIVDPTVQLLIKKPHEYSFPSGHTLNGITASVTLFLYHRREGIVAIILALVIAFSRLYLFVHYPTDILGGIVLGTIDALIVYSLLKKYKYDEVSNKE